jgi:amyloid beta precursor protein binding protein 1
LHTFLSRPDALKPFTLILIASPTSPVHLTKISEHAAARSIPLFYFHSVGFYAHFSIQVSHASPIVDTHPDPASTSDLRLLKPWPELVEYATKKTKDLQNLDHHEHGHVPYLLLLLYYLGEWEKRHEGKLPSTYREKNEFKKLIDEGMRRDNPEGGEENYEQAIGAVLKNLNDPVPNSSVREVLNAPETKDLSSKVSY